MYVGCNGLSNEQRGLRQIDQMTKFVADCSVLSFELHGLGVEPQESCLCVTKSCS